MNKTQSLTELTNHFTARVSRILDHREIWQYLHTVGIHPGDRIELLRKAPLGGPLHVRCNGRDIALGRKLAAKILVELPAAGTNTNAISGQCAD